MDDEQILEAWPVGVLQCVLWFQSDGAGLRGGVRRGQKPLAVLELDDSVTEAQAKEAITDLAQSLARPRGSWDVSHEPVTDLVVVQAPGQLRGDEYEQLVEPIVLADDLRVIPVSKALRDAADEACDAHGVHFRVASDLRGYPLYAFARSAPPNDGTSDWDPDGRLQVCVALSRLVRPTSVSFRYAIRLLGRLDRERFQVTPGPVRGFGAAAWTAHPKRDWLDLSDFAALRELIAAFDARPLDPKAGLGAALWYHEYAARTQLVDVRIPLMATAAEALVNTSQRSATAQFKVRLPLLANALGLLPIAPKEAKAIWSLRSRIVHGAPGGGLRPEDHQRYIVLEEVVRSAIKRAIEHEDFRAHFADAASVEAAFPLPPAPPRTETCPSCQHTFTK